jgi:hypothetical protein
MKKKNKAYTKFWRVASKPLAERYVENSVKSKYLSKVTKGKGSGTNAPKVASMKQLGGGYSWKEIGDKEYFQRGLRLY